MKRLGEIVTEIQSTISCSDGLSTWITMGCLLQRLDKFLKNRRMEIKINTTAKELIELKKSDTSHIKIGKIYY
jgi:hypothetical protein